MHVSEALPDSSYFVDICLHNIRKIPKVKISHNSILINFSIFDQV